MARKTKAFWSQGPSGGVLLLSDLDSDMDRRAWSRVVRGLRLPTRTFSSLRSPKELCGGEVECKPVRLVEVRAGALSDARFRHVTILHQAF